MYTYIIIFSLSYQSKQAAANGALAGAMGTGQIIGFMIGAIPMKAFIQRISGSQHVGDFEGNVLVACVIILVSFVCSWHTIMKLKLSGDFDRNNTLTDENPGCNQRRVHSHNNSNSNPDPLTLDNIENIDGMVLNGETDSSDGIVHHHEPNSSLEEYNDEEDSFMSTSVQSNSSSFCQLLAASYNLCSRDTPASFYAIALTTSLTWLAWFPYIYYATDFVAVYVFDGIPGRGGGEANEQYDAGVRYCVNENKSVCVCVCVCVRVCFQMVVMYTHFSLFFFNLQKHKSKLCTQFS